MSFRTSIPTPPRDRAGIPTVRVDGPTPPATARVERRRRDPAAEAAAPEPADAPREPGGERRPAVERWLQLLVVAFVPALGALWAPQAWRLPLLGVAAALCAVSFVLLARQDATRGPGRG